MKTRAAVAFGPSTPLEIVELSSDLGIARSIRTSAGGDMLGRHDIARLVKWCLQGTQLRRAGDG